MNRMPKIKKLPAAVCLAALLACSGTAVLAQDDTKSPAKPADLPAAAPGAPDEPALPSAATDAVPAPPTDRPAPGAVVAAPASPKVPDGLVKNCAELRASAVGQDPIGQRYLDLVESGRASARDLHDFGVFLARRYYMKSAEEFVEAATKQEPANVEYWLNLGTVRVQFGKLSSALVAYEKARKLDVNSAQAHYGIGVVHDSMRNYDAAVDSYLRALALDPSLGDPKKNPQAANNDRLTVVKLLLYQASGGGKALPLAGGPEDDPKKPKTPVAANGNGKKS